MTTIANLSFSTNLPPFYNVTGTNTNVSLSNLATTGNVTVTSASGTTNDKSTTVTSNVTSNGINYLASDTALNGNLLTVFYQAANSPQTDDDQQSTDDQQDLSRNTTNINGSGVTFTPVKSATSDTTTTTSYDTQPNAVLGNTVKNAAFSSSDANGSENITLKSIAVVGTSLVATYQLTGSGLPNDVSLASSAPPAKAEETVYSPQAVSLDTGPTFSTKGINSIGDLLANITGSANGNLSGALQSDTSTQATGSANAASVLAATISPSINLTPSSNVQVTDFVNPALNAVPTSDGGKAAEQARQNVDASKQSQYDNNQVNGATDTTPAARPTDAGASSYGVAASSYGGGGTSSGNGFSSGGASAGIYNAISNANASTIRGASLNTVA